MFLCHIRAIVFFFFQAEDGIRDGTVTGVQTCALPISRGGEWDVRPSSPLIGGTARLSPANISLISARKTTGSRVGFPRFPRRKLVCRSRRRCPGADGSALEGAGARRS